MTAERVGGEPSSATLPSMDDVLRDLNEVRQHEGASVRRITKRGKNLQQLRMCQDEWRRSGAEVGTLPMATIAALECAVRTYEPKSLPFIILNATLNFAQLPQSLTSRESGVMRQIGWMSKTTYEMNRADVFKTFAYKIQQQPTSFCRGTDKATTIAALPYDERVIKIRLLLEAQVAGPLAGHPRGMDNLLEEFPTLSEVPIVKGKRQTGNTRFVLSTIVRSRYAQAVSVYREKVDRTAWFIPRDLMTQLLSPDEKPFVSHRIVAKQLDNLVIGRGTVDESDRRKILAELGHIPLFTRLRLTLTNGGLFFNGTEPTRQFDLTRRRSMSLLAQLFITAEVTDSWKQFLDADKYPTFDLPLRPLDD